MIYIAICDDDEHFLSRERSLISKYMKHIGCQCTIKKYKSGRELLQSEEELYKYNIIFLDVNMKDMDGIETARIIRKYDRDVYLVFVTAYIDYSIEGYKVDAVRYILKDDDCLEKMINESIQAILSKMEIKGRKIKFNFQEGTIELLPDNIIYIESSLHKLLFYVNGVNVKKYTIYEKLDVISTQLEKEGFCRIHKSFLVNLKYVSKIERYNVTLINRKTLNIAKQRYPYVREEFVSYKGEL